MVYKDNLDRNVLLNANTICLSQVLMFSFLLRVKCENAEMQK